MSDAPGAYFSDSISPTLDGLVFGASAQAEAAAYELAPEMVAYAKFNAPWSDRTGLAREGLDIEVYEEFGFIVVDLFHTVDYGLWLEVIQNGRFATVMPTLETFAAELLHKAGAVFVGETPGAMF